MIRLSESWVLRDVLNHLVNCVQLDGVLIKNIFHFSFFCVFLEWRGSICWEWVLPPFPPHIPTLHKTPAASALSPLGQVIFNLLIILSRYFSSSSVSEKIIYVLWMLNRKDYILCNPRSLTKNTMRGTKLQKHSQGRWNRAVWKCVRADLRDRIFTLRQIRMPMPQLKGKRSIKGSMNSTYSSKENLRCNTSLNRGNKTKKLLVLQT